MAATGQYPATLLVQEYPYGATEGKMSTALPALITILVVLGIIFALPLRLLPLVVCSIFGRLNGILFWYPTRQHATLRTVLSRLFYTVAAVGIVVFISVVSKGWLLGLIVIMIFVSFASIIRGISIARYDEDPLYYTEAPDGVYASISSLCFALGSLLAWIEGGLSGYYSGDLWALLALVLLGLSFFSMYWSRRQLARLLQERERLRSSSEEEGQKKRYPLKTFNQIEIFRGVDYFEVRSDTGEVLQLNERTATQVHRYAAPVKDCSCNCVREWGPVDYEIFTLTSEGSYATTGLGVTDAKKTTLAFDRAAAQKVHAHLRPKGCTCVCLPGGIPATVSAR
jgi:hypothetical protein